MNTKSFVVQWMVYLTSFILLTELILFVWNIPVQINTATFLPGTPQGNTVVVTEYTDNSDLNPGDGICDAYIVAGEQCTLRAAIEELNAQGPDATPHVIEFNIDGTGPFTISPASELPAITVPVEIDGETQPGAACPTGNAPANLLIVLDGSNAGSDADGLLLLSDSDGSTIRGLVIGNFSRHGIRIQSNDNKVYCNHIGVGADGITDMGNEFSGVFVDANGNSIGDVFSHAQRNVISGNEWHGISLEADIEDNLITNNFIGTTADGLSALENDDGIYLKANNTVIGGANSIAPNVISGNAGYGIRVSDGYMNTIQNNYIGVARDGITPLPNSGNGIELEGEAVANLIGSFAVHSPGDPGANLIAHNEGDGVWVNTLSGGVPVRNQIRGNAIFNNSDLGIDLGGDGADSNDPGDGDTGENERQNYPVLFLPPGSTVLTGTLDSQANATYILDLYRSDSCDPSGYGEGQERLLIAIVTTDGAGHAEITGDLAGLVSPGDGLTATATDTSGNTSEFSACVTVSLPATPIPTDTPTPTPDPSSTPTATATPTPSPTPMCTPSPDTPPCTPTPPPVLDYGVYLPVVLK